MQKLDMKILDRRPWLAVVLAVIAVVGSVAAWRLSQPAGWHPGFGSARVKLTVAGGCPLLHRFHTVTPQGGSPTRLVPLDPDAVLICRYGPEPAAPATSGLYRSVRGDAATANRIARAADEIHSAPPPNGPISCPDLVASDTLLAFAYPDGNYATLEWQDSGCEMVDNGNLAAFQWNHGFSAFGSAVVAFAPSRQFEG